MYYQFIICQQLIVCRYHLQIQSEITNINQIQPKNKSHNLKKQQQNLKNPEVQTQLINPPKSIIKMSKYRLPRDFKPGQVFRMELSQQQMSYISNQLPPGYSFVLEPKKNLPKHIIEATRRKFQMYYQTAPDREDSASQQHSQAENRGKSFNSKSTKKNQPQPTPPQKAPQLSNPKVQKAQPSKQPAPTSNQVNPSTNNNSNNPNMKWIQSLSDGLKRAAKILTQLRNHKSSWPFLMPVDAEALEIPQYYEIIKEPMDLQTIQAKLRAEKYVDFNQFTADIMKIIQNSYRFNQANQDYLKITSQFETHFTKLCTDPSLSLDNPKPSSKQKKKKKASTSSRQFNDTVPVTLLEKKLLAQQIRRLGKQHLKGIKAIVFDHVQQYQDMFDLEKLSQKKLRELQKYVRNKIIAMEERNRAGMIERNQLTNLNLGDSQESSFMTDSDDERN